MTIRWRCVLGLLPLLVSARPASGANAVEVKDRAARMACLSGDYAKGVALLTELFVDTEDPTYLYNQGRCYEQNRRYDDAIARFQEYLRAGKRLSRREKADAEKHIAECEALLARQAVQQPAVLPVPVPSPVPPASAPVASAPPVVVPAPVVEQVSGPPVSDTGSGLRTTGVVVAAVGGAALVAGVALNLEANEMAEDMQNVDGYTPGKESDRKTFETMGWISYGVGAACVATGAVFYVLGLRSGSAASSSVAVVPALAPGQAGAVLKGAF